MEMMVMFQVSHFTECWTGLRIAAAPRHEIFGAAVMALTGATSTGCTNTQNMMDRIRFAPPTAIASFN